MAWALILFSSCSKDEQEIPNEVGTWDVTILGFENLPLAFQRWEGASFNISLLGYNYWRFNMANGGDFLEEEQFNGGLPKEYDGSWEATEQELTIDYDDGSSITYTIDKNELDDLWLRVPTIIELMPDSTYVRLDTKYGDVAAYTDTISDAAYNDLIYPASLDLRLILNRK